MSLDTLQSDGMEFEVDATGAVTLRVNFWGDDLESAGRAAPREYMGLRRGTMTGKQRKGSCGFDVTATYAGLLPQDGNPEEDENGEWEVDSEFSEEPIKSHLMLPLILETYQGREDPETGEIVFPKKLSGKRSGDGRGLAGGGKTYQRKGADNPAYGLESYFQTGAIVRRTRTLWRVPGGIFRDVGRVIERPPIPDLADVDWGDRNFLSLMPKPRRRGSAVELTEEWKVSGPGGWLPVTYGLIDRR